VNNHSAKGFIKRFQIKLSKKRFKEKKSPTDTQYMQNIMYAKDKVEINADSLKVVIEEIKNSFIDRLTNYGEEFQKNQEELFQSLPIFTILV